LKKYNETLLAVAKIGELVNGPLETSVILKKVVEITASIMKVDVCSIYLYDGGIDTLVLEATVGLKNDAIGQVHINPGEGITGRAAKQGRTVAVADVMKDKRNIYFPMTGEEEFHSLLSVPLVYDEELIGVLNVQTRKPRKYEQNERRLLKTIAHQISGLLRNARLFERELSARKALEKAQEKLIESEKMAALGRLAATMSHELRNPLAGLKGAAQLLMKKTDARDERGEYVELIMHEIDRLGRITEDLLLFAKPKKIRLEEVNPADIIDDALTLFTPKLEAQNISVHKRLSKLPKIKADRDKFMQVIVNIMLNSIDALPNGGELIVSSGVIREEPLGAEFTTFQFRDNGEGIPQDVLGNVFEPFYTTKAEGTGLGLAVCKTIIEEHGGRIDISSHHSGNTSAEKPGTVITVALPISERNGR